MSSPRTSPRPTSPTRSNSGSAQHASSTNREAVPPVSSQACRIDNLVVTDDIRQAALLAEGVAHALCGDPDSLDSALSCFRQLQEWPGSEATRAVRQQAAYNEAIVFRTMGFYGQCVLLLTELLGDPIPDTGEAPAVPGCSKPLKADLPDAIRFPARLARLAAFSQYTVIDWSTLPAGRAELLLTDAEKLVSDLDQLCARVQHSDHDSALAKYMYVDALRAAGHVELMSAINGGARDLYDSDGRPSHLNDKRMSDIPAQPTRQNLHRAIRWLQLCEQFAPDAGLYCDIAEASLLLRDFDVAKAYARHATLQATPSSQSASTVCRQLAGDPDYERAFYLATESCYLAGDVAMAQKYLSRFGGTPTLDAFKALCLVMQQAEANSDNQTKTGE